MRTYVATLGYHSTRVTRPVLSHGLEDDDRVILLRPDEGNDEARAEEAITDVERFLDEIVPTVTASVERLPHDDAARATIECGEILRDTEGETVVVFSGGVRELLVPFTTASLLHTAHVDTALLFSDVDGDVREWELPRLTASIPEKTRDTLAAIQVAEGPVSIPDLTDRTDRAKSTIVRHVSQLADEGVVETFKEGKTKHARLTFTGQLLLQSLA